MNDPGSPRGPDFLDHLFRETVERKPGAMVACLDATSGPFAGRRFEFIDHRTLVVGRERDCLLRLPEDPEVSRHHCILEITPPHAHIRDLGSSNGTRVNGRSVETHHLEPGDEIQVGSSVFRFLIEGAEPVPATVAGGSTEEPVAPSGELFPGFRLLSKLGEGGQGVVYQAQNAKTGELVAIKTLRPALRQNEEAVRTFLREAESGAKIEHPHGVRFLGSGFARGFFYFVMELVQGPSLAGYLAEIGGPLKLRELVPIVSQLVGVLDYAHAKSLVHRDVKPENILLAQKPPNAFAKLADFGLMRSFERTGHSFITKTGTGKGTVVHMPPEQVLDAKRVGPRADVYALGSTIFYALTLETAIPFREDRNPIRTLIQESARALRSLRPDLSPRLEAVLARALQKKAEDRHGSVREFGAEFLAASAGS